LAKRVNKLIISLSSRQMWTSDLHLTQSQLVHNYYIWQKGKHVTIYQHNIP